MIDFWIVIPPWIYAVVVTWLGQWRADHLSTASGGRSVGADGWWNYLGPTLLTNLVFCSLLPTAVLTLTYAMLPFEGAQTGLAVGLAAFLFGNAPARLLDWKRQGWDLTLWLLLIDLLRVGGSLWMIGWLIVR